MCGICGTFDISGAPPSRSDLARMSASIRHRGPDGWGEFLNGEIGLAHRRLSIIDIDGGTTRSL
jgi:asparagine synthase (glutamine-hydrolysing)